MSGLVTTSDGARLNSAAAASYERLNAAFTAAFGKRLYISSGARTHAQQVQAFTDNNQITPIKNNGRYITRTWKERTWYLKPGKATVAVPGTSMHEYPPGRAADFGSGVATLGSREHNWMRANAGRFGWTWTGEHFVTIEPWHWEHTSTGSASGGTEDEDDMPTMSEFLNTAAYDDGPTISEFFKAVDQGGVATQVWARTVARPGQKVPAIQELADAKTYAFASIARMDAMMAAIQAMAGANGLDSAAVMRLIEDGVKAAMRDVTFTADVDG